MKSDAQAGKPAGRIGGYGSQMGRSGKKIRSTERILLEKNMN